MDRPHADSDDDVEEQTLARTLSKGHSIQRSNSISSQAAARAQLPLKTQQLLELLGLGAGSHLHSKSFLAYVGMVWPIVVWLVAVAAIVSLSLVALGNERQQFYSVLAASSAQSRLSTAWYALLQSRAAALAGNSAGFSSWSSRVQSEARDAELTLRMMTAGSPAWHMPPGLMGQPRLFTAMFGPGCHRAPDQGSCYPASDIRSISTTEGTDVAVRTCILKMRETLEFSMAQVAAGNASGYDFAEEVLTTDAAGGYRDVALAFSDNPTLYKTFLALHLALVAGGVVGGLLYYYNFMIPFIRATKHVSPPEGGEGGRGGEAFLVLRLGRRRAVPRASSICGR